MDIISAEDARKVQKVRVWPIDRGSCVIAFDDLIVRLTGKQLAKLRDVLTEISGAGQYLQGNTLPKEIRQGHVLVHNRITPTKTQKTGVNGFRAWWVDENHMPPHLVPCKCGWAGLKHYWEGGKTK